MIKFAKRTLPFCSVALGFSVGVAVWTGCKPSASKDSSAPIRQSPLTFNRDIAPILFQHCAPCHRPGQSAPFSLLSHEDAKKHAPDIVTVTQKKYMPPWLPEPGYGQFANERRLSAEQISLIRQWVTEGAIEGSPSDLPPPPKWNEAWQLGKPGIVLQLPQPYLLGPEGKDVYRNFVIPIPIRETRYVQAVEFRAGNQSVHHVRIMIDQFGQSRRMDEQDPEPGFAGMTPPAKFPAGHILTWVPGKLPIKEPDGLPWVLEKDTDLVLQLHLQRTGKAESIQPAVGLYFTDKPPTKAAFLIGLVAMLINIPDGAKDYVIKRTFELPVDVEALGVLPHLHYLGREVQGFATLPDGSTRWLILIKNWDFNWQGDYRFAQPVLLPKGSVLTMRYVYDNSTENPRNPNHPPRPVSYGPQSTDEMGELWIQVVPRNPEDLAVLQQAQKLAGLREFAARYEDLLRQQPDNARAHNELGKTLGPLGQPREASQHFQAALQLDPSLVEPHYYLGLIFLNDNQLPEARAQLETALRLSPDYAKAHAGLGLICLTEEKLDQAEVHFKEALRFDPGDSAAREYLARIKQAKAETKEEK